MEYTKIPTDTFKEIQLNAGILTTSFTPSTRVIGDLIGATSGGVSFTATPSYSDYGDDIDYCPKNTKELKKLESWEATLSGTFVTLDTGVAKLLVGAGAVDSTDATKIVPRNDVLSTDFEDIWWVGDYSDKNEEDTTASKKAGHVAIHVMNALSTGGFQLQSNDKSKGQFSFEFTGHYSMDAQDTPPFEIYIEAGE